MTKATRQKVFEKYGGRCAYTGHPLGDDWEVDHLVPRCHWKWHQVGEQRKCDDFDNLVPAIKIINHYKRGLDFEMWRIYIENLHIRLKKLPKKTIVKRTEKRKLYVMEVARLFGITPDKPFSGKFYFETLADEHDEHNQ